MDDDDFDFSDESLADFEKERQAEEQRIKNHPLFIQGQDIKNIITILLESVGSQGMEVAQGALLLESAMILNAKLYSMMLAESFVHSMQTAAIIRSHAEFLRLSNHTLKRLAGVDQAYVTMFREEMEKFRQLFKEFVVVIKTIDSDEPADEWGLFTR